MIKSLTVTNHIGDSIVLELGSPEKSGFLVLGVEGLGPAKANINTMETATGDGSLFSSSRITSRNIVLSLGFLESPTIEDVRQLSYKYFPLKKKIRLIVETDNRVCECYGYVESNEPNIFSNQSQTQISILCPDPYFYSAGEAVETVFSGLEALFPYEFSNESLSMNLLEFGNLKTDTSETIPYYGDSEIGVTITIHALDTVSNITIYNTDTRESMAIDSQKIETITGSGIIAGDDIIISTVKGDKHVTLLRNGIAINILNSLNRDADWFVLRKGQNTFAYSADSGLKNLEFRISNKVVYEGV